MANSNRPQHQLPPNVSLIQLTFDKITRQFNLVRVGPCVEDRGDVYLMLGMAMETMILQQIKGEADRRVSPAILGPQDSAPMSG